VNKVGRCVQTWSPWVEYGIGLDWNVLYDLDQRREISEKTASLGLEGRQWSRGFIVL